jgi:hypothetical protein
LAVPAAPISVHVKAMHEAETADAMVVSEQAVKAWHAYQDQKTYCVPTNMPGCWHAAEDRTWACLYRL